MNNLMTDQILNEIETSIKVKQSVKILTDYRPDGSLDKLMFDCS